MSLYLPWRSRVRALAGGGGRRRYFFRDFVDVGVGVAVAEKKVGIKRFAVAPGNITRVVARTLSTSTMSSSSSSSSIIKSVSQADDQVLEDVLELVRQEKLLGQAGDPEAQKVIEFVHPKDLEKCLGDLEIGSSPTNRDQIRAIMERVIHFSVKTNHHRFYNQVKYNKNTRTSNSSKMYND